MELLNTIFGSLLTAITRSGDALTQFAGPILYFSALCYLAWTFGPILMRGGGSNLGDILGTLVFKLITVGLFMYILGHWQELMSGIVEAAILFGSASGTADIAPRDLLEKPGTIWTLGQLAVRPLVAYDTWLGTIKTAYGLATNPLYFLSYVVILAAFLSMTLHHGALLIEVALCTACGSVMLPWSLLRPVGHLGEAWVAWLSGCFVRMLVSVMLMCAALPLFTALAPEPATLGAPAGVELMTDPLSGMALPAPEVVPGKGLTLALLGGAVLFAIVASVLPHRAARLVGVGLGLTGTDIVSGVTTGGRMLAAGAGVATRAIQGTSRAVDAVRRL